MPRYVAFLRAVNLGSVNKASKERLRELFESVGLDDVQTFRTSGNVVFSAESEPAGALGARIEHALEAGLGFTVPVFLRGEKDVRAIAASEPFDSAAFETSNGKLQVSLLTRKPPPRVREQVLAYASESDRLAFGKQELFLASPRWHPRVRAGSEGDRRAARARDDAHDGHRARDRDEVLRRLTALSSARGG